MYWRILSILIISVVSDCVWAQENELTNVDMLKERYLLLEKSLWLTIRSGSERTFVLQRIHQSHVIFFNEQFNEHGVQFTIFYPDQSDLLDNINHINITVSFALNHYLQNNSQLYNENLSVGFAKSGANMTNILDDIYDIAVNKDFFRYIMRKAELQNCMQTITTVKSPNHLLYEYYVDIAVAQLKAYALIQLSYMFLTVYNIKNYVMESLEFRQHYVERNRAMQNKVHQYMDFVNREVWQCDPDSYEMEGFSDQITRLVQGYIDNEVNLNPINDCKKTCSDYKIAENYLCYNGTYCAANPDIQHKVKCNGVVIDCNFIGSDMLICPMPEYSNRRYKSIKYDNGNMFGKDVTCDTDTIRTESWSRWFVRCTNCFCYCDEQGPKSDRYFSLRPVLSNTNNNMVITGVALRKHNRIFRWSITEKQLISNGQVNATIKPWYQLKVDDFFKITDYGIKDGIDYHTLNWQNRSLNLDVLVAPPGYVVTGIRFNVMDGHLALQIRVTKFDFNTGRLLNVENSEWIMNSNNNRTEIVLNNRDVSTKSDSKSIPDLENDKYVQFGPTGMEHDAAQTTIPFIDIQIVQPHRPVPLSGVGIYYKGTPNYGGFIAPKIITYDYSSYIRTASKIK